MYIKKDIMGGMDWHDIACYAEQIKYNGSYFVDKDDVISVIIQDLIQAYPYISPNRFLEAIQNKTSFEFPILFEKNGEYALEDDDVWRCDGQEIYKNSCLFNGKELACYEAYPDGITCNIKYVAQDISLDDLCFVVQQNFLCPSKGVPNVERIYCEPFSADELEAAKLYAQNGIFAIDPESRIELLAASRSQITNTNWYALNMRAIELMKEKEETPQSDSFHIFTKAHIEKLEKIQEQEQDR